MTTGPVIAIVDDDPSVRRALHRLVQSAGYTVRTFASAPGFLDSLPRGRAPCLVLDIHLDGMSGFDLQQRLAANGVDVLWKPLDERALLDAIRRAIGLDQGPIGRPHAVD